MKYVTPLLLIFVFLGALFTPIDNNWVGAFQELLNGNGWTLDNGSLIRQLTNADLKHKLASATDPTVKEMLTNKIFYSNAARTLLLLLFIGISALVYIAYRKRKKTKKTSSL